MSLNIILQPQFYLFSAPYPHMHCMQVWNLCNCMHDIICSNQKTVHITSSLSFVIKAASLWACGPHPPTNVPWSSYINGVWMVCGTRKRLSPYDHEIPLTVFSPSSAILRKTSTVSFPKPLSEEWQAIQYHRIMQHISI
jgi:hypothetical protein